MPKKGYCLSLFSCDDVISNLLTSLKSEGHCDSKWKVSSRYTIQEALRTVSKPEKRKKKRRKRKKSVERDAGSLVFNFQC